MVCNYEAGIKLCNCYGLTATSSLNGMSDIVFSICDETFFQGDGIGWCTGVCWVYSESTNGEIRGAREKATIWHFSKLHALQMEWQ